MSADKSLNIIKEMLIEYLESCDINKLHINDIINCLEYNVIGGKFLRGDLFIKSVEMLMGGKCDDEDKDNVHILAWCIEIFQGFCLILDDIMDCSAQRRGKPSWHSLPNIQLYAINDAFLLESLIYFIIDKKFSDHVNYSKILRIFHKTSLNTSIGQLMDTKSSEIPSKEPIFEYFTEEEYKRMATYKTSFYTFYMPIVLAFTYTNKLNNLDDSIILDICKTLGYIYQVQNDYLGCFGNASDSNNDIEEGKCTWLIINALKLSDDNTKIQIKELYKTKQVDKIKELYINIGLKQEYNSLIKSEHLSLTSKINAIKDHSTATVLNSSIKLIFR